MNDVKIGKFIRRLMFVNNYTVEKLAKELNANVSDVNNWLVGVVRPSDEIIDKLVNMLNISKEELLMGEYKTNVEVYKKNKHKNVPLIIAIIFLVASILNIINIEYKKYIEKLVEKINFSYVDDKFQIADFSILLSNNYKYQVSSEFYIEIKDSSIVSRFNSYLIYWCTYQKCALARMSNATDLVALDSKRLKDVFIFDSNNNVFKTRKELDKAIDSFYIKLVIEDLAAEEKNEYKLDLDYKIVRNQRDKGFKYVDEK